MRDTCDINPSLDPFIVYEIFKNGTLAVEPVEPPKLKTITLYDPHDSIEHPELEERPCVPN